MQYTHLSYIFFIQAIMCFFQDYPKIWAYTTINAPNPKLHCKGRTFHHYPACTVYKPYKASLYNNVLISRDLQNIKGRVVVGWIVTMLGSSRVGLVCHWERSGLGAKNGSWNKKNTKLIIFVFKIRHLMQPCASFQPELCRTWQHSFTTWENITMKSFVPNSSLWHFLKIKISK